MERHHIVAILEDIRSALNVGAMFRTADAAAIAKLVLTGITPYPPHNKIPKTALGSIATVPWEYQKDTAATIASIAKQMPLVAIEITPDAEIYTDFDFPDPVAIILGNEISGVSQMALSASSTTVRIPMFGSKESLNVATTFGIIVYEIIRQWQRRQS